MATINERLQQIVNEYYMGNESKFARDTGIGQSTLNGILGKRKNSPSSETITKILSATVVKINPDWLITGIGEKTIIVKSEREEPTERQMKIALLQERIDQLKKENEKLTAEKEELIRQKAVADYLLKLKENNNAN